MLDIKKIRENPKHFIESLKKRGGGLRVDEQWRKANAEFEDLRSKQKSLSKTMGMTKANVSSKEEMRSLSKSVKKAAAKSNELRLNLEKILLELPNVPDDDVVSGGKENNKVIKKVGEFHDLGFPLKDHVTLCKELSLIDYERGVKLAGNGNWIYRNQGAILEWALINYFVSSHLEDNYEFILPPHILTYASGVGAGQFPKFKDDVFLIDKAQESGEQKFLLPTSETALINIYRDEILEENALPIKLFSYTPCYRREAGSYRSEERGSIRGHQFNKVEMFHFAHPDESKSSFEELIQKASSLVEELGLHFRVSKLAAGDVSASMRSTYDVEVYIPSMGYKEVSSVSNAGCYQARRANIRFHNSSINKKSFVHTLNGSGLATSRLIPAIVEQFQDINGRVAVPKVLRPWIGKDYLS